MSLPKIVIPRQEKDEWTLLLVHTNWVPPAAYYGQLQGQWHQPSAPQRAPTVDDLACVCRLLNDEQKAVLRAALEP